MGRKLGQPECSCIGALSQVVESQAVVGSIFNVQLGDKQTSEGKAVRFFWKIKVLHLPAIRQRLQNMTSLTNS